MWWNSGTCWRGDVRPLRFCYWPATKARRSVLRDFAGPYKEWLSERIAPPRDYELGESLRCPANIARTFERAARYYSKLPREERPARQRRDTRAAPGGHLIYVAAENQQQATSLIEELCDEESLVVVSLEDEVPEHIWSPALIKGSSARPWLC